MKEYQLISILKVFVIYILTFLPTWSMLFQKKIYSSKKSFLKANCLAIFIEIILFLLIYIFPQKIVSLFSKEINIQNYMIYSLKILFIASSTTVIHYSIPFYFLLEKRKRGILLLISKTLYLPLILLGYMLFNTKGVLFSIPICDIFYDIILLFFYGFYFN